MNKSDPRITDDPIHSLPDQPDLGRTPEIEDEPALEGQSRVKRALSDKPAKRGMVVITLAVLVVAGVFLSFSMRSKDSVKSTASSAPPPVDGGRMASSITPLGNELLQQSDAQRADNALASGTTALATAPVGRVEGPRDFALDPVAPAPVNVGLEAPQPQMPLVNPNVAPNAGAAAAESEAAARKKAEEQERLDRVNAMYAAIASLDQKTSRGGLLVVSEARNGGSGGGLAGAAASPVSLRPATTTASVSGGSASGSAPAEIVLVPEDTTLYALTANLVNSDISAPVWAKVVGGKYDGATLRGGFKRQSEFVVLEFSTIVLGGTSYPCNAIALDPKTTGAGLASDVDHHYLQRYGGLFVAAAIGAYGEAIKATPNQTQVVTQSGAVVTETRPYTTDQLLKIAGGAVGSEVASALRGNVNRPPTVKVDKETEMAVRFLAPVVLKGG